MRRYKGMVSGLIERALAKITHPLRKLPDSGQELKNHPTELTQDYREYGQGALDNDRCDIKRDYIEYGWR